VLATLLAASGVSAREDSDVKVRRKGLAMGLDPGIGVRIWTGEGGQHQTPLYARFQLRVGGCPARWVMLSADMVTDMLVSNMGERQFPPGQRRFGMAAAFFVHEGLFLHPQVLINPDEYTMLLTGLQVGYEFSIGKRTAVGLAAYGEYEFPIEPGAGDIDGWITGLNIYLSAYDLLTRPRNEDMDDFR